MCCRSQRNQCTIPHACGASVLHTVHTAHFRCNLQGAKAGPPKTALWYSLAARHSFRIWVTQRRMQQQLQCSELASTHPVDSPQRAVEQCGLVGAMRPHCIIPITANNHSQTDDHTSSMVMLLHVLRAHNTKPPRLYQEQQHP